MDQWQLQTAKARMSELVKRAQDRPQEITLHGKSAAVVLSRATYDQLVKQDVSLVDFIRNSPFYGVDDFEFERDKSKTREVII
jgi:prevent-host-death family protein